MAYLFHLLLLFISVSAVPVKNASKCETYAKNPTVRKFQEYVRIDTSQTENIDKAVEFWRCQATSVGLPFKVYKPAGKPICVITLQGRNSSLPSIMLNSHMDVVSAEIGDWTYPPFSAHIDDDGNIFGRGTQDDKDVAIQYFEAMRILKWNNVLLERTFHMTLMPDEETGGFEGIKAFVNTSEFHSLNIGFALDEGLSSPDGSLFATYVDKRPWQMEFIAVGTGGHGSAILESAMEKVTRLVDAIMEYRAQQKIIQTSRDDTDYGSYSVVNVNILEGGFAVNVVPTHVKIVVDMRLAESMTVAEADALVASWIERAGANVTMRFIRHDLYSAPTAVDDSNVYWTALREVLSEMDIELSPIVLPATSDMMVIRELGIPALGFSPKTYTTSRIHGANEYLNAETLLRGVEIYVNIMKRIGNLI